VKRTGSIGHGLSGLGIRKGDRVCIYPDSSPEYLISYLAICRIGAVTVPTNIVYRGDELLHALNDAGASAIIMDSQGAHIVTSIRCNAPALSHIICTTGPGDRSIAWSSFPPAPPSMRAVNCAVDDICHIQYTQYNYELRGSFTHGNWMNALDTNVMRSG
jgi:long-chain acyl-CoA synthetase